MSSRFTSGSAVVALAFALRTAACAADSDAPAGEWQLVHAELDSALICVAGTTADDVWTVGASSGDALGALALHYDGTRWERIATNTPEHLWWVHVFGRGSTMAGGTGGTILRYDGNDFAPMNTPGRSTVYGIWGASEDDVWAVGGEPEVAPGFVWRFDGTSWRDVSDELPTDAASGVLFKVWGQSSDDVWFVGENGRTVHWDGESFEATETDAARLFTVHGVRDGEPAFVAVGGDGHATILEHDGTDWHDVTPETGVDEPAIAQLFGVSMRGPEHGYAVGYDGTVLSRDAAGWSRVDLGLEVFQPFHSVWIDPDGGVWAVGGNVLTPALDQGLLVHSGEEIADVIDP